jgi:hypothetical protein
VTDRYYYEQTMLTAARFPIVNVPGPDTYGIDIEDEPAPVDDATLVATYLRVIHSEGFWIVAWEPMDDAFVCVLTNFPEGSEDGEGHHFNPITALRRAMDSLGLP